MIYAFCAVTVLLIGSVVFNIVLFSAYDTIREAYDRAMEELKCAEHDRDLARQAIKDIHAIYREEITALRKWGNNLK